MHQGSEVVYPGFINNFLLTLKTDSCPLPIFIAGFQWLKSFQGGWAVIPLFPSLMSLLRTINNLVVGSRVSRY